MVAVPRPRLHSASALASMPRFAALLAALLPLAGALKPTPQTILSRRLASFQSEEATVRCLLLPSVLPRQRLELTFRPPVSQALKEVRASGETLALVGVDRRKRGKRALCRFGVEGRIESMSAYLASDGYFSSHSLTPLRGFTAQDTVLVGGRRFELLDYDSLAWPPAEPVFAARVRWLEDERGCSACFALAEALEPLVGEWLALVRSGERERSAGQMRAVLADLGPMPTVGESWARTSADDVALWVAALINPQPALGVAREVRPAVLEATGALARLEVAHSALVDSIAAMRRMPPGPFEVEPPPGVVLR